MKMYMPVFLDYEMAVDDNVYYSETKAQKRADRLNKLDNSSYWCVHNLTVRDKQVK